MREPDWERVQADLDKLEPVPVQQTIPYNKPPKALLNKYKFEPSFSGLADTYPPSPKHTKFTTKLIKKKT